MSDPATDLTEHAARLLVGTGVDAADAASIAAGHLPADSAAARALRDGWTAPDTIPPLLLGRAAEATS